MSFLKFTGHTDGNGRGEIRWGRAKADGAPYRGHGVPLLREQEFEELSERVYDSYHGTFDTSKPDMVQPKNSPHGLTLQQIIERRENDWFQIRSWNETWFDREDGPVMFVFVVWSEPYQELPQSAIQGKIDINQETTDANSNTSYPGGSPSLLGR